MVEVLQSMAISIATRCKQLRSRSDQDTDIVIQLGLYLALVSDV